MIPKLLGKCGVIGICSPSHIADRERYADIAASLKKRGYGVVEADNLYKSTYGCTATPEERADDFNQLVADKSVDLIFFGGGEAGNEVVPYIDFELLRKNPKQICSYSDGTTILNAVWANTGIETYYGQDPGVMADPGEYNEKNFNEHLVYGAAKEHIKSDIPWKLCNPGKGKGILIGGYSRNFALLLGSRYFKTDKNEKYILFIEDHEIFGGTDYVSAMLSEIEQHDFMENVSGFIFGHYSEKDHPELTARISRLGKKWNIPAVYCDDFGHGDNHAIIPIGRRAELDTDTMSLKYCI